MEIYAIQNNIAVGSGFTFATSFTFAPHWGRTGFPFRRAHNDGDNTDDDVTTYYLLTHLRDHLITHSLTY